MKQKTVKQAVNQLKVNGVSEAKIVYKYKAPISSGMSRSQDVAELLQANWDQDTIAATETFSVLLLDRRNNVKGIMPISSGGTAGTVVDVKVILCLALLSLSESIILAHNHPSGQTTPSDSDIRITKKIREAGKFIEVNVLDHLIIAPDGTYFSMADEGII